MSDTDFLLHVLRDGFWHSQHNILEQSFRERGHGLTVNSRAADLRKLGYTVECQVVQSREAGARKISFYRLVEAPTVEEAEERDSADSQVDEQLSVLEAA